MEKVSYEKSMNKSKFFVLYSKYEHQPESQRRIYISEYPLEKDLRETSTKAQSELEAPSCGCDENI